MCEFVSSRWHFSRATSDVSAMLTELETTLAKMGTKVDKEHFNNAPYFALRLVITIFISFGSNFIDLQS